MASDLEDTLAGLKALSVDDRLRVVAEVWDSLEDDTSTGLLPEEQVEIDRRLDAYEANRGNVLTWDQVLSQLQGKL